MTTGYGSPETVWRREDVKRELQRRSAAQLASRTLSVSYYRIGYRLDFPLPFQDKPREWPTVPGIAPYPWFIWLSWALEERWRVLRAAWRDLQDADAGRLYRHELVDVSSWPSFRDVGETVHLVTGHLAGMLALALNDSSGGQENGPFAWQGQELVQLQAGAQRLIDLDVWPWYLATWADCTQLSASELHNIRVIILVRAAQLARTIGHPGANLLEGTARKTLNAWCEYRSQYGRTEGTAYDAYLLDSVTEWVQTLPDREHWQDKMRAPLASFVAACTHMVLPGQYHCLVPLGDVEPEMTSWMTVLGRLVRWYRWPEAHWLFRHIPVSALPAAALTEALALEEAMNHVPAHGPVARPVNHLDAVTLRTGWSPQDCLVAVGANGGSEGHLHPDGGSVVISWNQRLWISDPGYQQYRPGRERDFTLGVEAHNQPVIAGYPISSRRARVIELTTSADGTQQVVLDLTSCYSGLPPEASIRRTVLLLPRQEPGPIVMVRDELRGLGESEVAFHWQGSPLADVSWGFRDGFARQSCADVVFWITTRPGQVSGDMLYRHDGSRGQLTLRFRERLASNSLDLAGQAAPAVPVLRRWWIFIGGPAGWEPPRRLAEDLIGQAGILGPERQ